MKRFVVIGLGNFGASLSESLFAMGHEVIAIDRDGDVVDLISTHATRAVVGDGRSLRLLERIGVRGANAGVVSTGDDITASILATLALQDLGVKELYVKVISRDHARVMERIGVTESIFPERESALSLGTRIAGTALLNYVRLGAGFSLQEMALPDAWDGKTLRELSLRQKYDITVVAVHDVLTDTMQLPPDPDAILKGSDTLLVAGKDSDLARTERLV
jgi:trk system potassium uptake protein